MTFARCMCLLVFLGSQVVHGVLVEMKLMKSVLLSLHTVG